MPLLRSMLQSQVFAQCVSWFIGTFIFKGRGKYMNLHCFFVFVFFAQPCASVLSSVFQAFLCHYGASIPTKEIWDEAKIQVETRWTVSCSQDGTCAKHWLSFLLLRMVMKSSNDKSDHKFNRDLTIYIQPVTHPRAITHHFWPQRNKLRLSVGWWQVCSKSYILSNTSS